MTKTIKRGTSAVHYITLLLTTAAIILTLLAISMLTNDLTKEENPTPKSHASSTMLDVPESQTVSTSEIVPKESDVPCYTVILSEGELRLSTAEMPDHYTVLDGIDPRTLRDSDRKVLESGLQLESEEALVRFLEDFSS